MNLNDNLKIEINELLEKHQLNQILSRYGDLSITGSYVYNLMAWRDYDIVLKVNNLTSKFVYSLVKDVGVNTNPDELKVLNNVRGFNKNRPIGYWIGIYIEKWKIDLWVMDEKNANKEIKQTKGLDLMLSNINKEELVKLKLKLSENPDYHKKFSSVDLYHSYIDGIRNIDEFYKWLNTKNNDLQRNEY